MKSATFALVSAVVLSQSFTAHAGRQIVPAGSLINCTISETKLSSKTADIGDPVLCQASMSARNGTSRLPFDSYIEGRFEDYKDPGHFVGKGWMELKFDRIVIEPDTIIPLSARVVDAPGYVVDKHGRILGKGHRVRDIVEWSIPILWPIDLLNLPRRGPRPTLKSETRLTLKVMDDMEVPDLAEPERDPYGLRHREPSSRVEPPADDTSPTPVAQEPPPAPRPAYQPAPAVVYVPQPVAVYAPMPAPVYYVYSAMPPPPAPAYFYAPPPMVAGWGAARAYMYAPPRVTYRAAYPYGQSW
jgi:hypothetical protein